MPHACQYGVPLRLYIRFHDFRKRSSVIDVIADESFDHQYLCDASLNCTINRLSETIEATHVGRDWLPGPIPGQVQLVQAHTVW
jgi:hypothetical protein